MSGALRGRRGGEEEPSIRPTCCDQPAQSSAPLTAGPGAHIQRQQRERRTACAMKTSRKAPSAIATWGSAVGLLYDGRRIRRGGFGPSGRRVVGRRGSHCRLRPVREQRAGRIRPREFHDDRRLPHLPLAHLRWSFAGDIEWCLCPRPRLECHRRQPVDHRYPDPAGRGLLRRHSVDRRGGKGWSRAQYQHHQQGGLFALG